MNIEYLKRLMDGLGMSQSEAMEALATKTVFSVDLGDLKGESPVLPKALIAGAQVAAVAAEYGMLQLYNPPGSGVLVYVERILSSPNAAGNFVRCGASLTANPFTGTAFVPVNRNVVAVTPAWPPGQAGGAARLYYGTQAALIAGVALGGRLRDDYELDWGTWILGEDAGVIIQNETVNVAFAGTFWFTEVPVSP
jgi:hypothetical protein